MPAAIHVEALSKRYFIGELRQRSREFLGATFARRLRDRDTAKHEVWALRDVSFAVQPGEAVGIVGANGAGKSTLLKILSRVTEPTSGRATLRGRLHSLLEVGTGFHPELTGRENIFLKAAVHGLTRAEAATHLDDIVSFSGVEQFLDTPLKRYSSGMRVRLAFAVASALEREILILDEVLVVGDAAFKQQALARIRGQIRRDGTTVLLVSHQASQIRDVCERALLLDGGHLVDDGPTAQVLTRYHDAGRDAQHAEVTYPPASGTYIAGVRVMDVVGAPTTSFEAGAGMRVAVKLRDIEAWPNLDVSVSVSIQRGPLLFRTFASTGKPCSSVSADGTAESQVLFEALPLLPGRYTLAIAVHRGNRDLDVHSEAVTLTITGVEQQAPGRHGGPLAVPATWSWSTSES